MRVAPHPHGGGVVPGRHQLLEVEDEPGRVTGEEGGNDGEEDARLVLLLALDCRHRRVAPGGRLVAGLLLLLLLLQLVFSVGLEWKEGTNLSRSSLGWACFLSPCKGPERHSRR